jgi:uncharacterized membrane protein YkvA (DUF1232 family)
MTVFESWKDRARGLRLEVYTLYVACRDPRTPWYAKALAAAVAGYAFSPIDLIPDFVPLLGYLDDLILVPLGILVVRRMIPAEVLADCRIRAQALIQQGQPISRTAAVFIVVVWLLLAAACIGLVVRRFRNG